MQPRESLTLDRVVHDATLTATANGFNGPDAPDPAGLIALMHSELSEALEEYRNGTVPIDGVGYEAGGKPVGFGVELADCLIRIAHACGRLGIDLNRCVREKLAYNRTRPFKHGNKRI